MYKLVLQALLVLLIFVFVAVSVHAAPAMAPSAAYYDECIDERCDDEEVRELWSSFQNECFTEKCVFEEVRELSGGNAHVDAMYQAFRTRLGKSFLDPFSGTGPYQGTFRGVINGVGGSSASLTFSLTHEGTTVRGTATLGSGLRVDTGGSPCPGVRRVSPNTFNVRGNSDTRNPNHLDATSSISDDGNTVDLAIHADLSEGGNTMTARIELDVPWPCSDSTVSARLSRS
jgi:hypothetical protein